MIQSFKKFFHKCRDCFGKVPFIGSLFKAKPKVAVIRFAGVIADTAMRKGGISLSKYEKLITSAFDVHNLRAVALVINSPGGSPVQSELIANHIRALAKKHKIPVYAFVEDVAASGGYWLACAADKIYAAETAITGSIGVISASFGFQDFIDKYGIERRIVTSGKDKSFLDPFVNSKPADVKRLKAIQGELHQSFIDWVKQRRGKRLKGDDKTLFEGAFWTSKIARDLGIIDGIADMRTHCKSEFGDDVKFIPFAPNTGLLSTLMGGDSSMQTSLPEDILSLAETRSLWARFGL